jgi:hypothetical protein
MYRYPRHSLLDEGDEDGSRIRYSHQPPRCRISTCRDVAQGWHIPGSTKHFCTRHAGLVNKYRPGACRKLDPGPAPARSEGARRP